MSHKTIAETYRQNRAQYPETFGLRIHRTLSWLHKADTAEDEDTRFIALWIAFNAAYAREMDYGIRAADKGMFVEFLAKICRLDKKTNGLPFGVANVSEQHPRVAGQPLCVPTVLGSSKRCHQPGCVGRRFCPCQKTGAGGIVGQRHPHHTDGGI